MEFIAPTDGPYIYYQGKKWLDFSSCDFLGLAQHPEVKKTAIKYTLKYGVGIPVSPLGSLQQQQIETKLAQFLGTEMVLFFPSLDEVKDLVKDHKMTLISSDEVEEKKGKKTSLCIDDSFMMGITGQHGFGAAAGQNGFDLIVGSLGYGIGCSGAFAAGSKKILSSWTPSHPLSFPQLGALDCAINLISEMVDERKTLEKHYRWLQSQINLPCQFLKSPRAIVEFKSEKEAQLAHQLFAESQIFLTPPQENTLCIVVTALHTPDDLDQLATVLRKFSVADWALAMQSLTPAP